MKKALATLVLLMATTQVFASCPAYAPYGCKQAMNGKMICGCGVR